MSVILYYLYQNFSISFKKIIFIFSKDALNASKVTVKTFIMLQKLSISKQCCSLHQKITVSTKILSSTTVFNIDDNNQCFLSSKSAY